MVVAEPNESGYNDLVLTSVRLPRWMRDELEVQALGYRHGRSAIIREAIEEKLAKLPQRSRT